MEGGGGVNAISLFTLHFLFMIYFSGEAQMQTLVYNGSDLDIIEQPITDTCIQAKSTQGKSGHAISIHALFT